MLAAAGLIFDAQSLLYAGVIVLALVAVLWIWSSCFPPRLAPAMAPQIVSPPEPDPVPTDGKGRSLVSLRKARQSAAIATGQRGDEYAGKAFHELEAAMLSIKREFGIGPLRISSKTGGTVPFKVILPAYITFVDRIYPLLREGHIEEATAKAKGFKWTWAEED